MPAVIDYLRSIIRTDTNSEFFYNNGYEWQREGIPAEDLQHRIPTGESGAADGEYQTDSFLNSRVWSFRIKIIGTDAFDVKQKQDAFMLAHPVGPLCKLRRQITSTVGATVSTLSDVFLECRIASRSKGPEKGFVYNDPEIGIRSGKPYYQDTSLQGPVALNPAGGTVAVAPGGTEKCEPVFTLVCTTAGTVTLLESFYGNSITFTVVPGTYVLDCSQPVNPLFFGGVQTLAAINAGGAFKLSPTGSNITITFAAGAALSSASVQWRRCWAFS